MTSLSEIRSVADAYLWKLHAVGIDSVETLYARCSTAEGCERVAAATGIDRGHLDQWMHHADLLRLGLSDRDAELLEAAGVLTSLALAHRDAHVLRHRLRQVN